MKVKKFSQIFEGGLFDMMWDDGNKNVPTVMEEIKGLRKNVLIKNIRLKLKIL